MSQQNKQESNQSSEDLNNSVENQNTNQIINPTANDTNQDQQSQFELEQQQHSHINPNTNHSFMNTTPHFLQQTANYYPFQLSSFPYNFSYPSYHLNHLQNHHHLPHSAYPFFQNMSIQNFQHPPLSLTPHHQHPQDTNPHELANARGVMSLIDLVSSTFQNEPNKTQEIFYLINAYSSGNITQNEASHLIENILENKPDLIPLFKNFIFSGHPIFSQQIQLIPKDQEQNENENQIQNQNQNEIEIQNEIENEENLNELVIDDEQNKSNLFEKKRLQDAISLINNVNARFSSKPEKSNKFIKIIQQIEDNEINISDGLPEILHILKKEEDLKKEFQKFVVPLTLNEQSRRKTKIKTRFSTKIKKKKRSLSDEDEDEDESNSEYSNDN
ncbi:hypothetical protein M0811_00022 [Anaeramoeba ignava]|uniref:Uncharacterized protein n=1 Tax=Anaeramoeba ignava TaxID=1746090 RepID=A0A9Q0LQ97_ANAIG|nr:hypothetical protein M0811_00022 [Anaeramoeba ignava]